MNKKIFSLFLLFLFASSFVLFPGITTAGLNSWTSNGPILNTPVSPSTNYSYLESIAFSSTYAANGKIFAGDETGYIYIYDATASTWSSRYLGAIQNTSGNPWWLTALTVTPNEWVFAGSSNGYRVYRSKDSGNSWEDISRFWQSGGVSFLAHWSFAASPGFVNDQTIFMAGNDGIMRSTDGGGNWENKNTGLNGGMMAVAVSPDYSNFSGRPIFTAGAGGVYRSFNDGNSWQAINSGFSANPSCFTLAISPNFPVDHTLFAGVDGDGFYTSTNGGDSWVKLLNLNATYSQKIVVSPNFQNDRTIVVRAGYSNTDFIAISRDAGSTWSTLPSLPFPVRVLAISPNYAIDQTIFAGVQGSESINGVYSYTFGPPPNQPPTADAGDDQTIIQDHPVSLDGTGSSDPEGDSLTYAWIIIEMPESSNPALSDSATPTPTFIPDMPGDYTIQLVVTDQPGAASLPDTVTISSRNSRPVADAGLDQSIISTGTLITLKGESWDPDGDNFMYLWTILTRPDGSSAALSDSTSSNPTFTADIHGSYEVQLVITDVWGDSSDPDTMEVNFENVAPVANAGMGGSAVVGETVSLDGSASIDANGDSLTYFWSFTKVPDGSSVAIANPTAAVTSFTPDLPGAYVVQLTVDDGFSATASSATAQFQVTGNPQAVITAIQELEETITTVSCFKNRNMPKTLINKLNAVIANIEAGNYQEALGQLEHDILAKTDGCAEAGGTPDKNDWITCAEGQNQVYPQVQAIIAMIQQLMAAP